MDKYQKYSLVKPDEDIYVKTKRDKIIKKIVDEVNKYLVHFASPDDIKLVRYIATLIENLVKRKDFNKLGIFVDILKLVFPDKVNGEIIKRAIDLLEDLLKNKQIKKIPVLKYALHLSYELVKEATRSFFFPSARGQP
jgi:hypothetical protein